MAGLTRIFLTLLLLTGCYPHRQSREYQDLYAHLQNPVFSNKMRESDYFLIMLVEARHLDYSETASLLKTVAKHPSDGSKNGDVGHAWIYLKGKVDGEDVFLEGGHSGELGVIQAKYFDGIMDYYDEGDANPIRYLWENQNDGFFQWGSGGHEPTFAAKIDLTEEQFLQIQNFVKNYSFAHYCLTGNQCSSFVARVAEIADLNLEDSLTFFIEPSLMIAGEPIRLWSHPQFSQMTISSPDILEKSLIQVVQAGKAEYALDWYLNTHQNSLSHSFYHTLEKIRRFPERYYRYKLMTRISHAQ